MITKKLQKIIRLFQNFERAQNNNKVAQKYSWQENQKI